LKARPGRIKAPAASPPLGALGVERPVEENAEFPIDRKIEQ
jgi:hypothetical protein